MKHAAPLFLIFFISLGWFTTTDVRAESMKLPITADTYVDTDVVDRNHANDPDLILGLVVNPCSIPYVWSTLPVYCKNYRTQIYLEIDTNIIEQYGILPTDISSASVFIYKFDQIENDSKLIDIYSSPSSWNYSTVTWANSPAVGSIITQGQFTQAIGWQNIELTSWLKNVLNGSVPNNGVVIRTYNSNEQASMFYSSRCLRAFPNLNCLEGQQPYLFIEYTTNQPPSTPNLITPLDYYSTLNDKISFSAEESLDPEGNTVTYLLEIARDENFNQIVKSASHTIPQWEITMPEEGEFFWRVAALDAPLTSTGKSYSGTRHITRVHEEIEQDDDQEIEEEDVNTTIDQPHDEESPAQVEEKSEEEQFDDEEITQEEDWDQPDETEDEYDKQESGIDTPKSDEVQTNSLSQSKSPSGESAQTSHSSRGSCDIDYYVDTNTWKVTSCDIPAPLLTSVEYSAPSDSILHSIRTKGSVSQKVDISIHYLRCKGKSIWDWKTWLHCVYEHDSVSEKTVTVSNSLSISVKKIDSKLFSTKQSISRDGTFQILSYAGTKLSNKKITIKTTQHLSLKIKNRWVDTEVTSPESNTLTIPESPQSDPHLLSYPFGNIIGVTQWHGFTAYQSPHTGIDFGATGESILSPADGTYVASGYDTYYGSCLSGGYYLVLKHENGSYSAYFHLKNDKKPDGTHWSPSESVRKGQPIGVSGNSGSWNCQPLSYHLHYEIRNDRTQSSHTDPVPLTSIDWNLIKTIGWEQNSGRLTGDNPHPSY